MKIFIPEYFGRLNIKSSAYNSDNPLDNSVLNFFNKKIFLILISKNILNIK